MGNRVAAQATKGPVRAVPCPWCSKPNDCSEVEHLINPNDLSQGPNDPGGGPVFTCDHCNQKFKVVAMEVVKFLSLRQVPS